MRDYSNGAVCEHVIPADGLLALVARLFSSKKRRQLPRPQCRGYEHDRAWVVRWVVQRKAAERMSVEGLGSCWDDVDVESD